MPEDKDFLWSDRHRKNRRKFMTYIEAKSIVNNEKIKNRTELEKFIMSKAKPDNFPELPQMAYQRKGWKSFEEFFL